MKWIMLLSGVLTSTMIYAAIAPDAALQSTFGESRPNCWTPASLCVFTPATAVLGQAGVETKTS